MRTTIKTTAIALLALLVFAGCAKEYTIRVESNNQSSGTVSGGGTYAKGTDATLTATAFEGYHFVLWQDGDSCNPRVVRVKQDATFIAIFAESYPVGSKSGLFTVNANGDQVRFSQGNLQYQASTGTWRFAENQWDYVGTHSHNDYGLYGGTVIGSDNCDISPTYDGWIDLFGFGTSGWNSGANAYMPYSTNTENSDYLPGGSEDNGLTGDYAEADWAWHNAISNGGNTPHLWRTLSCAEWGYLIGTRLNTTNLGGINERFVKSLVNGVYGVILFPDGYLHPMGIKIPVGINSTDETGWYGANDFTLEEWAEMEAAGAIFLPTAGYRYDTNVLGVGIYGGYWSSTHGEEHGACAINYNCGSFNTTINTYGRRYGYAVRPVQDYVAD